LSTVVGDRSLFLGGLVAFTLASLACGLAPNIGVLIAARGIQGIGAAMMVGQVLRFRSSSILLTHTNYSLVIIDRMYRAAVYFPA
jgi:MFS family permease